MLIPSLACAQTTIHVTNLYDNGVGSLRACIQSQGPRECIIDVAGYIDLLTPIKSTSPDLIVKGETAPSPGIHVRQARIEINAPRATLRHFSVRPGDSLQGQDFGQRDAIVVQADDVTLDHMSLTYGIDENLSTYTATTPVKNFKVISSLIANGLWRNGHPENEMKNGVYKGHSMGVLLDRDGTSLFHKNVIANNVDRHIRVKQGNQIEFVNNYVHNWGGTSGSNLFNMDIGAGLAGNKIIFQGNVYKQGSGSSTINPCIYNGSGVPTATKIYANMNICPTAQVSNLPASFFATAPMFTQQVMAIISPQNLIAEIFDDVGARPWDRFPIDSYILDEVKNGTGKIRDCITNCNTNPDGTVDVAAWPWPAIVANTPAATATATASASPTETSTAVPTATRTATPTPTPTQTATMTPTIEMCSVPCSQATPQPTATPTITPSPTRTATPTATATPGGACEQAVVECMGDCEDCQRYFNNGVAAHPYNPNSPCSTHLTKCQIFCEECR